MPETRLIETVDPDNDLVKSYGLLAYRVIGSFPISIGTSLAFESLFKGPLPAYDVDRVPPTYKISGYDEIWINIAVIYRNIYQSVKPDESRQVSVTSYVNAILYEIEQIKNILQVHTNDSIKPIFYSNYYNNVYKNIHKHYYLPRYPNTKNQLHFSETFNKVLAILHKQLSDSADYKHFTDMLKPDNYDNVIIITQYVYDLLNHSKFKKLSLLESYTGILKERNEWNSKYYDCKKLELMKFPFNRRLLFVFGDNLMLHPMHIKFRKTVIDIGNKKRWNALTSDSVVYSDVSRNIIDPGLLIVWNSLLE